MKTALFFLLAAAFGSIAAPVSSDVDDLIVYPERDVDDAVVYPEPDRDAEVIYPELYTDD